MLWHIQTSLHAFVIFGGLLLYRLWFVVLPVMGAWVFFSIQKVYGA